MYFNLELKYYKPYNNALRFTQLVDKSVLTNIYIKNLYKRQKYFAGRNHFGRIVNFRQGGRRFKKKYLQTVFNLNSGPYLVFSINTNSIKSGLLCGLWDLVTKQFCYILSASNVTVGNVIRSYSDRGPLFIGHQYKIENFPMGMPLFNINNIYIKAAGTFGIIRQFTTKYVHILLPSGRLLKVLLADTKVFFGNVSNAKHKFQVYGKAGRLRNKGRRPTVRGIAMNPVDHPHGGRTNGGKLPLTPWGKPARGVLTRKKK